MAADFITADTTDAVMTVMTGVDLPAAGSKAEAVSTVGIASTAEIASTVEIASAAEAAPMAAVLHTAADLTVADAGNRTSTPKS